MSCLAIEMLEKERVHFEGGFGLRGSPEDLESQRFQIAPIANRRAPAKLQPKSPLNLLNKLGSTPTPWPGPFPDHGLRPWSQSASESCKPYRIFCLWRAHFGIWSRRPRAQGVGVDPCLLICGKGVEIATEIAVIPIIAISNALQVGFEIASALGI